MLIAARAAGDDPVQLRAPCAAAADRHHRVARVDREREREQRDRLLRALVARVRQQRDPPRRERAETERGPRRDREQVRQHERVRAPRFAVVVDRVRERGPRRAERDHHEGDDRRDLDRDGVDADLGRALVPDDELAVDEVDHPERERRRDERHPELLHAAVTACGRTAGRAARSGTIDEREVDEQRPGEVPDDQSDRALLPDGDEENRRDDRQEDVRDARDRDTPSSAPRRGRAR